MPFLLDTNIVSELRKQTRCHPRVWRWYDATPLNEIFVSVITLGEMRRGVEKKRRRDVMTAYVYESWLSEVKTTFADRVLPVTVEIGEIWGSLGATEVINPVDALIAATAIENDLTVATRNERDFQRVGVDYFNPFEA